MAPPASRRSKQNSSPSPPPAIPLPGIAIGLFAAIAAGLAASRMLRRKRQNLQDGQPVFSAGNPTSTPLLVQEREIEIGEKDDLKSSAILVNANGTIATATHGPAKFSASLKPGFDAIEEASLLQIYGEKSVEEGRQQDVEVDGGIQKKIGANTEAEEAEKGGEDKDDEEKDTEKEGEEDGEKKAETLMNGEISGEGVAAEITVEIEASLVVDEASMEALESGVLSEKEEEEDKHDDDNGGVVDEDTGDDDRSSSYQQPSPVLSDGRIFDFFEEMSDLKDDPDLLSSGSNSLSDAISESSMQEVSSAPVKPFLHAEEAMEASWIIVKPDFVGESDLLGQEEVFSESSSSSQKLPAEVEKNLKPFGPDVYAGVLDLKPITVEIVEKDFSVDEVKQIKFDIISDITDVKGGSVALKGEVSIEVSGLDEKFAGSARINGKVLSDDLPLPEELSESEATYKGEHVLQAMKEGSDDITCLEFKGKTIAQSVRVNGKVLSDDSSNDRSLSELMITDEPIPHSGQERIDGTVSGIHGEPSVQATTEVSGATSSGNSERALRIESTQEVACLESSSSEERLNVHDISEEVVLQSGGQNLDVVDGTSPIIAESNVNIEREEPSLSISSPEENTEGNELNFEASTCHGKFGSDRKDDGLAEAIIVESRVHAKQQEIEEITRSNDASNLMVGSKGLTSLTDSAHVSYNKTRDVDNFVLKGAVHEVRLQTKGGLFSKVLEYLPLEIGLICLLIALVSFVLWYLEMSSSEQ